jgi:hypothetical protein
MMKPPPPSKPGMTPAQQLAMKKANKNRTDAKGNSGFGASNKPYTKYSV